MGAIAMGAPTKEFFVGMLTRDIELCDAILDLLDNCLDGVVRQKGASDKNTSPNYYSGFYSNITITNETFIIEDNCGGIPRDVAEKYAFRMGRSPEKGEDELPTVGIYGIGMKRAIFKIGKSAKVITRNDGNLYQVTIPSNWADSDDNWEFPLEELDVPDLLLGGGTRIQITDINLGIIDVWNSDDKIETFSGRMAKAIQQSYSFIIQKGFEIKINNIKITPLPVQLLIAEDSLGKSIKPFVYKQTFGDVDVSLAVGFYAPPPSPEDIDDENNLRRSSSDAGWTVVCNDRVVLYNDKSHLTGWGEGGVPQYHTQFIGIRGIVIFESKNPKNLPMTTTKRGVDTSSKIYSAVKDKMRQGLKLFTDYTNRWKGQNVEERKYSAVAKSVPVETFMSTTTIQSGNNPLPLRKNRAGLMFKPDLPKPPNDKPYKVIRYSKDVEAINDLIEHFYNDRNHSVSPSQIGEKCFDVVLERVRSTEE